MSKNLKRVFAALVASLGVLAFAGCQTGGDNGGTEKDPDTGVIEGPGEGGPSQEGPGQEGPSVTPPKPVIPTVPEGSVQITEAAGDLEAAYTVWNKVPGAMGYNVYCKAEDGDFVKLDDPLVREYKDYCRADAVGLKAGKYTLKVVPTGGENLDEDGSKAATAENITVLAHERSGYAFAGGTASGAYNEDGTLKSNADVLYVTDANKDTVELNGVKGIQNIFDAQKKAGKPLAVRLIGKVTSPDITESKANNNNKNPDTVLIKGDGKGGNMAVTFEGIGSDATAYGWTLRVTSATNVEVRNIGFMCTQASEPDDITLEKDDHIWIHNCDLFYGGAGSDNDQAKGDGALDTKESTHITHSYNHFWDSGKCNLQGMKSESTANYITYHHNWYDHSDSRHPRVRTCTTHVYNNYFDGNAKYGVGITTGASVFVENNYFRSTATMRPMMTAGQGTDATGTAKGTFSGEDGGVIKAYGNYFDGKYELVTQKKTSDKSDIDCYEASSRDEVVPAEYTAKKGGTSYSNFDTAADFYEYQVDTPEVAKQKVEKYAGRVGGGDFKWEFNDATEDANYSIITALKTALINYSSDLVKAGGVAVSSGSTSGGTTSGGTEEGGTTGGETTGPVEGEVSFIPSKSGNGFTVTGDAKSHSAIEVAGVSIPKNSALKLNSSGKVEFETSEEMTLYLYLLNSKAIKVDGSEKTLTAEGSYYVVSLKLSAGKHEIIQSSSGENSLYLIKLVPVTT